MAFKLPPNFRYFREGLFALIVLAAGFCYAGGVYPLCRFKSEVVILTVANARLHVNGLYRYEHKWPMPVIQGFSCPFPTGDGFGPVEDFSAEIVSDSSDARSTLLPVDWIRGSPYFHACVQPGKVCEVRIHFSQPITDSGKYFLTTTRPWLHPLEHGRYELHLPDRKLVSSNYPCTEESPGNFSFERTDFFPDQDWIFKLTPMEPPR